MLIVFTGLLLALCSYGDASDTLESRIATPPGLKQPGPSESHSKGYGMFPVVGDPGILQRLNATSGSPIEPSQSVGPGCPPIWTAVALDLKRDFSGCNQLASNAIRFAFHDAAGYSSKNSAYPPASGGADGSLLLSDEEIARPTENPLQVFRRYLLRKFDQYKSSGVSAADLVQFAGSVGVKSCPGGPVYKTLVGREDDANAAPAGTLPEAFGAQAGYDVLIELWADKGISPRELAALMGAHSVSRAFAQQNNGIPPGAPQDTTPQSWDTTYFRNTQAVVAPHGVYRFDSDMNLANASTICGQAYTEFGNDAAAWSTAFAAAMYRLSLLGIPDETVETFADCTSLLQTI